jgi:hypothetical protein
VEAFAVATITFRDPVSTSISESFVAGVCFAGIFCGIGPYLLRV